MNIMNRFLKGIALGAGAIAPGVSGGALAVIFGLYDKITYFIANFTENFKENLLYFLPVGLGGVTGVLLFSKIIEYLFKYHEIDVRYAFTGLMLGTIPSVVHQANKKGYRRKYLIPFFLLFTLTVVVVFIENNYEGFVKSVETTPLKNIFYGSVVGFGTIVPGISASLILMYIGAYEVVIKAISNIQIDILFYLGIGFVLSILLFAKLISFLFERAYGFTYYAIMGLVVGSIISIFPGYELSLGYAYKLILMIACFIISYSLSKMTINTGK